MENEKEKLDNSQDQPNDASINSSMLAPIKESILPEAIPETAASGAEAAIGSSIASLKAENENAIKLKQDSLALKKNDLDAIFSEMIGTNKEISLAPGKIDRREEDKFRREADRLTSEIEAEQLSNRRRIERMQKNNPNQMFRGALEAEINRVNRESVSKQADLAILQNSALRNYTTANSIADRQLELKLEPLKMKLENLKLFFEYNKSDFDKEDERLYKEVIKNADREYETAFKAESDLKDMKMMLMKNGTPSTLLSSVLKAKTIEEVQKIPGISKYLTSESDRLDMMLKRAQLAKINAEVGEETPAQVKAREKEEAKRAQLPVLKEKISLINKIKESKGLNSRVGPSSLLMSRKGFAVADAFGAGEDFAASVQQLTNQDTLTELLELKAAGGTLGAISNKELDLLQKAANKINAWEKKNKDGIGRGVWDIDEKRFRAELDQVIQSTQRIYDEIYKEVGSNELDDYLNTVSETMLDPSSVYINSGYDIN